MQERMDRQRMHQDKHNREIEEFDLHSTTLGLDTMHIVEATQDYNDDDNDSVRGSVLSLTPSTSTNSFTHSSHTQL